MFLLIQIEKCQEVQSTSNRPTNDTPHLQKAPRSALLWSELRWLCDGKIKFNLCWEHVLPNKVHLLGSQNRSEAHWSLSTALSVWRSPLANPGTRSKISSDLIFQTNFESLFYCPATLTKRSYQFSINSIPCRPKGSPFVLFWDIIFGWRILIFSKGALGANIYEFWGGSRKNAIFWSTFSKKFQKTLFRQFFKIGPAALKIWQKQGLFTALGDIGKSVLLFCWPNKKRSTEMFDKFLKIRPPRQNPISAPV